MICSVLKDCFSNFQIMLDQLEEELLLMDEVNRKENFTFMDNITMEENSNRTGIQVKCRYMMNDDGWPWRKVTRRAPGPYILKVGVSGDRVSANFFHFPPKFRLRTLKPSRIHCTNASPSVCRLCFVFNINTSYIDLYIDLYSQFLETKNRQTDSANLSTVKELGSDQE